MSGQVLSPVVPIRPTTYIVDPRKQGLQVIYSSDLPSVLTGVWSSFRKSILVMAIEKGMLDFDEALIQYDLHEAELASWIEQYEAHGQKALEHKRISKNVLGKLKLYKFLDKNQKRQVGKVWHNGFWLDFAQRTVSSPQGTVKIPGYEWKLFTKLWDKKGAIVIKEELHAFLYPTILQQRKVPPEKRIVEIFICKLRKRLSTVGARHLVVTVWGRGYRFSKR